jgi:hypothetical protein
MIREWCYENGFWSYEKEMAHRWENTKQEDRDAIIKYMKLMKRFSLDPSKVGLENKKWLLQNSDCETDIMPSELVQRYLLD